MTQTAERLTWDVRTYVYQHIAQTTQPPSVDETAAYFGLPVQDVARLYSALDAQHAFFLEPGSTQIRIANPFSAVETPFRVHVGDKTYWANCAWDALGVPAALHTDALIEASYAVGDEALDLTVVNGQLVGPAGAEETVAHVLVPFRQWYEDMTFT